MTTAALDLRQERLALSKRRLVLPSALFLGVLGTYSATVAAILASEPLFSLILVPIAGLLVIMLFVIGHDACHQSYTSSRLLNNLIGRIAFLPSLHVYSLWDHEHNQRHHRFNNIRHLDYAWIPMSPDEFANAGVARRLEYRFYRDPGGVLFYYLLAIWPQRKIFPRRAVVGRIRVLHVVDTLFLWSSIAVYLAVLTTFGGGFGKSVWVSLTLGFLLPFLIFMGLFSVAIFLHHTHYDVPWYASKEEWERGDGAINGTVHVEFPWFFRKLILHIMEHNGHHYAPGVPLYRLSAMQELVKQPGMMTWQFSFWGYFDLCARCKLFDYEASCWFDFNGRATGTDADPDLKAGIPLPRWGR